MIYFKILGELEMVHENRNLAPNAPKVKTVLALLVVRANRVVSREALFEELWGQEPPKSAVTTTQTYIYQLRKTFSLPELAHSGRGLLVTRQPGYALRIEPAQIDARVFARLAHEGKELFERHLYREASEQLQHALDLWAGPPLSGVDVGPGLEAHVVYLEELRTRTLELRIQADIQLGRSRELIPELHTLISRDPLNEWFHARLIDALHRSGRRGDALRAYQRLRTVLNRELGLEPAPELQRLQSEVLNGSRTHVSID